MSKALDSLADSIETMAINHGTTLGSETVARWKNEITKGEEDFAEYVNAVSAKAGTEGPNPGVAPLVPKPAPLPENSV